MIFRSGGHICRTVGCSWLITSDPHFHSSRHLDPFLDILCLLPPTVTWCKKGWAVEWLQAWAWAPAQACGRDTCSTSTLPCWLQVLVLGQVSDSRYWKLNSSPGALSIGLDKPRTCLIFMVETLTRKRLSWHYPTTQFCSLLPVHGFS